MNQRIKYIRKTLGLTQQEFGSRLGVTDGAITNIEKGKRKITEQMQLAICREYGVNSIWLRTGEGQPFDSEQTDLDRVIDALMAGENETARAVFKALAAMGGEEWETFRRFILNAARGIEPPGQKKE
jgi:transcriptional regulator with XRE-family HTH domain